MDKYEIEICRTSHGFATVTVEAKNSVDAMAKAREIEGDQLYSEKDAEYEIVYYERIKDG